MVNEKNFSTSLCFDVFDTLLMLFAFFLKHCYTAGICPLMSSQSVTSEEHDATNLLFRNKP